MTTPGAGSTLEVHTLPACDGLNPKQPLISHYNPPPGSETWHRHINTQSKTGRSALGTSSFGHANPACLVSAVGCFFGVKNMGHGLLLGASKSRFFMFAAKQLAARVILSQFARDTSTTQLFSV
jgi:hypothetical protein